jgi:electron transfer flavoprotein beta subunit
MRAAVVLRQVPDVVEELVIAADGRTLDEDEVMHVTNELDDHALEQALLLKERHGGEVTAFGVGGEEAEDALAAAVAKGADGAVRVPLEFEERGDNHRLAAHLAGALRGAGYDLILTGVQAVDEVDGCLGGLLAAHLSLPYVGGLVALDLESGGRTAVVHKEYPGGLLGAMQVELPAVLGIQSAEQPPRYVAVSRVMEARRSLQPEEVTAPVPEVSGLRIAKLSKPEAGTRAEILEGSEEAVADQIVRLLKERGLL